MKLLAIDTATSALTAAVTDGDHVIGHESVLDPRRTSEELTPLIRRVLEAADLRPSDLTDIAVGTGPGPFTGLRVGLVTAQVMALATGAALHGVCSLDAVAQQVARRDGPTEFLVATDARRKEVYWARYHRHDGGVQRLDGPAVQRPADLDEQLRQLPTAGRGPLLYPEAFGEPLGVLDVDGEALAELAMRQIRAGETMPTLPMYLRRPDAQTTAERAMSAAAIPPQSGAIR